MGTSQQAMLHLLLLSTVPLAAGHGGMLWPPSWQDGVGLRISKINDYKAFSDPIVRDPISGRGAVSIKNWLTDQAYIGGHGDQYLGVGNITNPECKQARFCMVEKNSLGGSRKRPIPW